MLTLCGHWIVGDRCDFVTSIFADNGCQWVDCGLAAFHCPWSIQDAISKIVDAHFSTKIGCCRKHLWLERQPIVWLCINVATQSHYFGRCNAKNRWRSRDAQLSGIVTRSSNAFFPRNVDNILIKASCHATTPWLCETQGIELLAVWWCSYVWYSDDVVASIFVCKGGRLYHDR